MKRALKRGASRAGIAVGALLLAAGVVLLMLPCFFEASFNLSTERDRESVDAARELIVHDAAYQEYSAPSAPSEAVRDDEVARAAETYREAYPAFKEYNESLIADGQKINDPFADEEEARVLSGLSAVDGLIGSVSVPSMGCDLPLRYGASYEHMAVGAVLVSGTSIPLGEGTSNCLIAAHRGWNGASMFRDIERVRIGDELVLRTPWDVLCYRAVEMRVINPSDTDLVCIQEGRDLVTLVTCHPYGQNYQRYVVYFERVPSGDAAAYRPEPAGWPLRIPLPVVGSSTFAEDALRTGGAALLLAFALYLAVLAARGKRSERRAARLAKNAAKSDSRIRGNAAAKKAVNNP